METCLSKCELSLRFSGVKNFFVLLFVLRYPVLAFSVFLVLFTFHFLSNLLCNSCVCEDELFIRKSGELSPSTLDLLGRITLGFTSISVAVVFSVCEVFTMFTAKVYLSPPASYCCWLMEFVCSWRGVAGCRVVMEVRPLKQAGRKAHVRKIDTFRLAMV